MSVNLTIPTLESKFADYRDDIIGDSYNWGPTITTTEIKYFTFHHSVTAQTAKDDGNWKKECDVIAGYHVNGNGWGGVGYRFIICSEGTVAYVGDLSHGGSAVGGFNNIMFSACLVGDFTKVLPTSAQVHSAYLLAKHFLENMPQYPNLKEWGQIKGHRDFNQTTCPSPVWRDGADTLRSRIVDDRYQGYPNPQPTWSIPQEPVPPQPPSNQPIPQPTPAPEPEPTPVECPEKEIVKKAHDILYGSGFWWIKLNKLKTLISK